MTQQVGTIIATDDSPTTEDFSFVLEDQVKKEQFVEFDTEEGRAIARVAAVRKTNQFFMNAESVSESRKQGVQLREQFPTDEQEHLVAEGTILGVYNDDGLVKRPSFPPSPGTNVHEAETERLRDFLGLAGDDGIQIGDVQFQDLPASLDLTKLFQKHLAILAQSGAGKSYLASVMIEELLDREPDQGQLGVVALDPHGEYAGFAKDPEYGDRVEVYTGEDIKISCSSLTAGKLAKYFGDVSSPQKREIKKILDDLDQEKRQGKGVYGLEDIKERVEEADMPTKTKQIWQDRLNRMQYMNLFKKYDNPSMDRIDLGKMIVLDLSDIVDYKKKQIIASYFADKIFRTRMRSEIPPVFFLVEEAHNFAPENVSSSDAIARGPIQRIAREGRKFHASLGLISQRPVGLSTTALSQCNTHIILRVTNPNDLDRIKQSAEGITSDVITTIPGLRTGECILVGEAVDYPAFVSVRERNSDEFETGKALQDVAQQYHEDESLDDDDIDAFM